MVRAAGLEPAQHFRAEGFSYPATAFAAFAPHVWREARFGVWTIPSPLRAFACCRCCPSSLYTFAPANVACSQWPERLARDCHFTGFPEFEQFCTAGFPASTQVCA